MLNSSKRKANSFETDNGKEFVHKLLKFLELEKIKRYSRSTSKAPAFVEIINRTHRNLLKKLVFEKRKDNWMDEKKSIVSKPKIIHSTNKATPTQASLKKNKEHVYNNILDRKKLKPSIEIDELVRIETITQVIHEAVPS